MGSIRTRSSAILVALALITGLVGGLSAGTASAAVPLTLDHSTGLRDYDSVHYSATIAEPFDFSITTVCSNSLVSQPQSALIVCANNGANNGTSAGNSTVSGNVTVNRRSPSAASFIAPDQPPIDCGADGNACVIAMIKLTGTFPSYTITLLAYAPISFDITPFNHDSGTITSQNSLSTHVTTGQTADDPVGTSVRSGFEQPYDEGTIDEGPITNNPPPGFTFVGQQVSITAADHQSGDPYFLDFDVDPALVPAGQVLRIVKDGVLLPMCWDTGSLGFCSNPPSPHDPQIGGRSTSIGGTWNLAVGLPSSLLIDKTTNLTRPTDELAVTLYHADPFDHAVLAECAGLESIDGVDQNCDLGHALAISDPSPGAFGLSTTFTVRSTLTLPNGSTMACNPTWEQSDPCSLVLLVPTPSGFQYPTMSPIFTFEPPTKPAAPAAPTVLPASGSATVTFSPRGDGGSPITGYSASCSSSDGGASASASATASPIVVSGLTNANAYTCTVTAENAVGSSDPSPSSASFVPATVPDPPALVLVTLAGTSANVFFTTPPTNGGSTITSYSSLCASSNGGAARLGTGAASPISVPGLSSGKSYVCYVAATNAAGTSTLSAASNAVTVATAPGAPTGATTATTSTTGTTGSLIVSFSPPASSGGSAITGYTVSCSSSNGGVLRTGSGTGSPITVTGATTGKSYSCTVAASNAIGTGSASTTSPAVVLGVPAAPTAVAASSTTAAGSLIVSFAAGANNGAAVSSYAVTCLSSNGGVSATKTGAASPLTVAGLTSAKTYTCTAKATSSRGTGPASVASPAVIVGAPAAPTNVKAVSASTVTTTGALTVTYTAAANNGAAITGYTATCTSSNGGMTASKTGTGTTLSVTGLTTAKTYTCAVTATNSRGAGVKSAATAPVIVGSPAAPTGIAVAKTATGQLRVTFTAGANNGAAVSTYTASCVSSNGGVAGSKSGTVSPLTVTGLSGGKTYTCTVVATNARGAGLPSATSTGINA